MNDLKAAIDLYEHLFEEIVKNKSIYVNRKLIDQVKKYVHSVENIIG